MQNATVKPFLGTTSTNFTWTVWVYPQNVWQTNSTPVWLDLDISTCPGATGNGSLSCIPSPTRSLSSIRTLNRTILPRMSRRSTTKLARTGFWEWQMGLWTLNRTTHRPFFQLLVGDPDVNGIEGPVIGGFGTIYGELILSVDVEDLIYLGAPFYFVLLIYMLFKNRERRKKDAQQRAPGPIPDCRSGERRSATQQGKSVTLVVSSSDFRSGHPIQPPPARSSTARSVTPWSMSARRLCGSAGPPSPLLKCARSSLPRTPTVRVSGLT